MSKVVRSAEALRTSELRYGLSKLHQMVGGNRHQSRLGIEMLK